MRHTTSSRAGLRLTALSLALSQMLSITSMSALAADTAVRVSGSQVFAVTAPAGGLSASDRVRTIQRNLDNALVAASDRSPQAVAVTYVKGAPVLTLAGYYVATVDSQSAKAAGTTPTLLAKRWADGLKHALSNSASVESYVAQLVGDSGQSSGASASTRPYQKARLVYIPAGMTLPIKLKTSITTQLAKAGDKVEAVVTENVSLGDTYIPKGAVVAGTITDAKAGDRMAKSGTLTLKFDRLRTPDGAEAPITAHLVGGVESFSKGASDGVTLKGESTETKIKQAAIRGAIGAGSGVLVGTTIGAIAGHSGKGVARGALAGLAIGAGLGVAESFLLRKGKDVVIASDSDLKLQIDSPVTLSSSNYMTTSM